MNLLRSTRHPAAILQANFALISKWVDWNRVKYIFLEIFTHRAVSSVKNPACEICSLPNHSWHILWQISVKIWTARPQSEPWVIIGGFNLLHFLLLSSVMNIFHAIIAGGNQTFWNKINIEYLLKTLGVLGTDLSHNFDRVAKKHWHWLAYTIGVFRLRISLASGGIWKAKIRNINLCMINFERKSAINHWIRKVNY